MADHKSHTNGSKKVTSNIIDPSTDRNMLEVTKPTSLGTLILWNISKALEKNPNMDLKDSIKVAQARLDCERDVSTMIPDSVEQRHLACAVLAWQQLGHNEADSLCQFIANKTKEQECVSVQSTNCSPVEVSVRSSRESKYSKDVNSMNFGSNSVGPVVKLPVDTKIVMRLENSPCARQPAKKPKAHEKDTMNKIEAACCLDSACAERLAKMDTATTELRMRAGMLARREAERVELLERAEAAWRDLELGYQRRLTLAEEKEEDLTKQIQKAIEERNGYKNACTALASQLNEKGEKAEKERAALSLVDKEVCERACLRLKLSEESAQCEAVLAEHLCRVAQLDRDLQFKEEQARRKLLNFQSELESSQTITHETERAMRAELSALREQITQVSEQLLGEDAENARIRGELENLRQEKMGMVDDLEGCKASCDSRMQGKVDELKKKKDQLAELKDKVMECRCKLPMDATVEVKRTASLAALCRCTPEEKIMESCSCTSLRGSLLSNLLGDLFSGLQAEMSGTGTQMPCQLLKCLEDKHNWDRASIVKTNLKNYFFQLLIGELDIAIATSIEKYHAKWVGQSCADAARMIPDVGEVENEGWQERAIERRAMKLATELAEQLFQERADQLTQRAKDIVSSGPPPCVCKPQTGKVSCGKGAAAVFPVLVPGRAMSPAPVNGPTTPANTPAYWRQTLQDMTQLRAQIEDLKKDSIKKEDLKLMEEKITKFFQRVSTTKAEIRLDTLTSSIANNTDFDKKEEKINRAVNSNQLNCNMNLSKSTTLKKKQIETYSSNKRGMKPNIVSYNGSDKNFKPYKKLGQTYAINMCMCSQKDPSKIAQQNKISNDSVVEEGKGRKDKSSKDSISQITKSVKQSKPINSSIQSRDISTRTNSKSSDQQSCQSNCICFHKVPSNTSIDKLLETLAKWKSDLKSCETEKECEREMPCCIFLPGSELAEFNNKKQMYDGSNLLVCCKKEEEGDNTCITPLATVQKGKKVSDIEEESIYNSKISSKSSVEKTELIRSSTLYDERHNSTDDVSFSKIPSKPDNYENTINVNSNKTRPGTEKHSSIDDVGFPKIPSKPDNYKNIVNSNYNKTRPTIEKHNSIDNVRFREILSKPDNDKNTVNLNDNKTRPAIDAGFDSSTMENGKPNLSKGVCCDSNTNPNMNTDSGPMVPTTTESEYMGAINLDKSNEDFCKCINRNETTTDQSNEPFKCMPCKCSCKSFKTQQRVIQNSIGDGILASGQRPQNRSQMVENNLNNIPTAKNFQNEDNKSNKIEIFPCDCGYDIQFLGVTLTDVSPTNGVEEDAKLKECKIMTSDENNKNKANIKETNSNKDTRGDDKKIKIDLTSQKSARDGNRSSLTKANNGKNIKKEDKVSIKKFVPKQQTTKETIIDKSGKDDQKVKDKDEVCEKCQLTKRKVKNNDMISTTIDINESCMDTPCCECIETFKEFENYIDVAVASQQTNNDKALDVQSFKESKNEEESCVCCEKNNFDESEDLEQNTFHLLEEHLKKKLEEFKESSCNSTCIPPDEEEKLFTTILKRVKQVITDSTNKIACKCANEEDNSTGSWNRAYGLLQEYLKTKIKRVQCACVTNSEDNNETVLPEVLGKVCNLIEHDFQRLKEVCGCKKSDIQDKDNKQVYFKEEAPERDNEFLNSNNVTKKTMNSSCSQNQQISAMTKENIALQVPAYLGMQTKSCNPLETYVKDVQTVGNELLNKSLDIKSDCICCKKNVDGELIGKVELNKSTESANNNNNGTKVNPAQFSNLPYVGYVSKCVCKDIECTNISVPVIDNINKEKTISSKVTSASNSIPIQNTYRDTEGDVREQKCCGKIEKLIDSELLGDLKSKSSQPSESMKNECKCNPTNTSLCCEKNENIKLMNAPNKTISLFSNKPYIGYTIDCSCDGALGACVCTKSIFQADNIVMDNIMKKSMPDDKYYEKVSYIMKRNPTESSNYNNDLLSEMTGDLYLHNFLKHKTLYENDSKHDCETEASFNDKEDFILKGSREYFEMANTTTNTYDDNMSIDTDYSNIESPLDWCECCSQMPPRELNSDQLKQYIYFPVPFGNDDDIKKDNRESVSKTLTKHCDCDLVPICHVKMLVENIENKLVSAKCTCDSMITEVCPIHSTK